MMKQKLYLNIVILCILCGCSTHVSDCNYKLSPKGLEVYKDGNCYDGTIYSDDGDFAKLEVEQGIMSRITLYHDNGEIAKKEDLYVRQVFFDENGDSITESDFKRKYRELIRKEDDMYIQMVKHYIHEY